MFRDADSANVGGYGGSVSRVATDKDDFCSSEERSSCVSIYYLPLVNGHIYSEVAFNSKDRIDRDSFGHFTFPPWILLSWFPAFPFRRIFLLHGLRYQLLAPPR